MNLFVDNSILPQSGEELYFFMQKISRIFAGFGVSQTPKYILIGNCETKNQLMWIIFYTFNERMGF